MSFTNAQKEAVAARGNVLVVAGAGTGKTSTLVERCLSCLLNEQPRASLEELLLVTFTDAAAAEMRQRIRKRLEEERDRAPEDPHWQEQLALFETARIGTLHSFCLELVRQHFYELELDPQLSVMAEEEARLLADETLDYLLQKHYGGRGSTAAAVQQLIHAQGRGGDKLIRALVLRLHHYTQTLPNPAGWLQAQLALFGQERPELWGQWLLQALAEWQTRWLAELEAPAAGNEIAAKCLAALQNLTIPSTGAPPPLSDGPARQGKSQRGGDGSSPRPGERSAKRGDKLSPPQRDYLSRLASAATALETVCSVERDCPHGKKTIWLKPLEPFLEEAKFLAALTGRGDPLTEDWNWVRGQMATLLKLVQEFTKAFTDSKRELAMVDFHDLEQYSLRLLWDHQANGPTKVAQHWRKKLRFVFVDEYQDINAAQDKIIEALSREGPRANRFLVGDIKQSIYRFRLANPYIFQGYVEKWGNGQGTAIPLVDNFRSREGVLNFINSLFGLIMRREVGNVAYDEKTRLRFGAPQERRALSQSAQSEPRVELHLRLKGNGSESQEWDEEMAAAMSEVNDLEEANKEARLVALRLQALKAQQHPVWDEKLKAFRPVEWRDMAILLRSPSNKAESYAKEFSRLNVPLQVERGGFYESLEISDLLSLFQVLDNPLQDLPVLAVLHSPLVGLSLNELATIRLVMPKARYWTALVRWTELNSPQATVHSPQPADDSSPVGLTDHAPRNAEPEPPSRITHHASAETLNKVTTFLERFARWRRLARQVSLSRCLEAVLTETHYGAWLLTQPRGEHRHANVQRLVALAQEFDQFQRQGLFRFLRFIEAQQLAETEPEVPASIEENAVRLMSIHQSKGLEFPVVAAADLGKPFNLSDLRSEIILDEEYGICPQIKPPHTGKRYPSLPYWLARRRQMRELLGEELRLLYVALTRARDTLLLSATLTPAKFNKLWNQQSESGLAEVLAARCYADWLGLWFSRHAPRDHEEALQGQNDMVRWVLYDDAKLLEGADSAAVDDRADESLFTAEPQVWDSLAQRLSWQYYFAAATRQPAKTSVTALRRQVLVDEETVPFFKNNGEKTASRKQKARNKTADSGLSGADIGNAHHTFLQRVLLDSTQNVEKLKREAERLEREGLLTAEQVGALNFKGIAAFWNSDLGRQIRAQAPYLKRELSFTVRFAPSELAQLAGETAPAGLEEDFILVQGAADIAVILPEEIWLVDFKTDGVSAKDLAEKAKAYAPQLKLYALALSRIHRRPVTQCWLYFLARQAAVEVKPDADKSILKGQQHSA